MPANVLTDPLVAATPEQAAYDALAPSYDLLTEGYEYDAWLSALERLLVEHGLTGRRLLDVACGTGKSFLPMLARGYDVEACDLSPGMVEAARRKLAPREARRVFVADMRDLPERGPFDAATCLDDAVNHLLSDRDLRRALGSVRAVLRPGGLLAFDVNSLATYRSAFASEQELERGDRVIRWRGEGSAGTAPGERCGATIDVLERRADGSLALVSRSRHRQRHHPRAAIAAACAAAGLELVAERGQLPGGRLEPEPDEARHTKLVYLARRPGGGRFNRATREVSRC